MPDLVRPAYLNVPPYVSTAGPDAADLAESAGLVLDGEQRLALDAMLAERADGQWAAFEFALICARQNMKTVTFQAAALADLFLFGDKLIVWTAHLFRTTQEAFRDISTLIEGAPHLRRRVKKISYANGEEGIELLTGARLNFLARSKLGGRGLSGDKVFLDEAFELGPAAMGSLLPTLSARPNPQVRYGSSAGMSTSMILHGLRNRGRAGGDPSLGYVEWCAPGGCASEHCDHRPGSAGCALDDERKLRLANPALGRRLSMERIAAERRALPPAEFARERLGWWEDPDEVGQVIDPQLWGSLTQLAPARPDPFAFGITVSPDRSRTCIGMAGRRRDGLAQLELVADDRNVDWAVGWVRQRAEQLRKPCAVVLSGTALSLERPLADLGLKLNVVTTSTTTRKQATASFFDSLAAARFRHPGEPLLTDSATRAQKRVIGDGWVWDGPTSGPIEAATLALHGLDAYGAVPEPPPAPVQASTARPSETAGLADAGF